MNHKITHTSSNHTKHCVCQDIESIRHIADAFPRLGLPTPLVFPAIEDAHEGDTSETPQVLDTRRSLHRHVSVGSSSQETSSRGHVGSDPYEAIVEDELPTETSSCVPPGFAEAMSEARRILKVACSANVEDVSGSGGDLPLGSTLVLPVRAALKRPAAAPAPKRAKTKHNAEAFVVARIATSGIDCSHSSSASFIAPECHSN
jgi:hypothetical protein